jgi:hypothetical protein
MMNKKERDDCFMALSSQICFTIEQLDEAIRICDKLRNDTPGSWDIENNMYRSLTNLKINLKFLKSSICAALDETIKEELERLWKEHSGQQ